MRQSIPDSGLGSHVEDHETFPVVPFSLGRGGGRESFGATIRSRVIPSNSEASSTFLWPSYFLATLSTNSSKNEHTISLEWISLGTAVERIWHILVPGKFQIRTSKNVHQRFSWYKFKTEDVYKSFTGPCFKICTTKILNEPGK